MNESQLREIIKEEIQAVVTEGMLDSVGLQDVEVSEDDYEKFAAAVKAGYGGSIDKEDIPAKWEETIGHPLMKPELKNLTKRLMRDRLIYFGGDFDISEEKLNEGIMDDIQATWDSLNIPGPLVALLDKTEPMNKKVNDWFKKNMGNPVVRMLYKVLMSTDFGATPDMYRLDKRFEKGELSEMDAGEQRRKCARLKQSHERASYGALTDPTGYDVIEMQKIEKIAAKFDCDWLREL